MRAFGFLAVLMVSVAAQAASAADLAPVAADIAAAARYEIETKQIPSIAIALVDNSGVIWSGAWGHADAAGKVPATPDTVYRAGSVSKLFTDMAVMRLVEAGKLDLDAPITTYLPDFRPRNPFGMPITLRHLMTHRSGLVREPPRGNYFDLDTKSQADAVLSLNETTLVAAPGTITKYSNAGIGVVGEVVAKAAGMPYQQAVETLVLGPLGMTSSSTRVDKLRDRLAYAQMGSFDGQRFAAPPIDLAYAAAGNLYTTVGDLGRFVRAMLNHATVDGRALVKPATLDEMWRRQFSVNGPYAFGLGFMVETLDGHRVVGHGGEVYGFATDLRLLPDDGIGVVVFSTVDSGNSDRKLGSYALRRLLAAREGKVPPPFPRSEAITGEAAKRLSGWFSDGKASVALRIFDDHLTVDGPETVGEVRRAGDHYLIEDAQSLSDRIAIAPDASWVELDGKRYARAEQREPAVPPPDFAALIGEYGWEHNILRIYQRDGQPYVRIEWVDYKPLTRVDADHYAFPTDRGLYPLETLVFERDPSGVPRAAVLNGIRFPRRDFGAEVQERVRAMVHGNAKSLRENALKATPPAEPPPAKPADLVALTSLNKGIELDVRYAGTNNFMGIPLYEKSAAYMQRPAAEAVARAGQTLRGQGYGLLIHDAYRPWFVTRMFWDATPPEGKVFVADPSQGSRHNRGCAVDLTMYELTTGKPVVMTGRYDEMSDRSFANYVGGSDRERWLRDLLRHAMEAQGFDVYSQEWWHFDFASWHDYGIQNISFTDLERRK